MTLPSISMMDRDPEPMPAWEPQSIHAPTPRQDVRLTTHEQRSRVISTTVLWCPKSVPWKFYSVPCRLRRPCNR